MEFTLIRSIGLTTLGAGVMGHALYRGLVRRIGGAVTWGQILVGLGTAATGPLLLASPGTGKTVAEWGALLMCLVGGFLIVRNPAGKP